MQDKNYTPGLIAMCHSMCCELLVKHEMKSADQNESKKTWSHDKFLRQIPHDKFLQTSAGDSVGFYLNKM